MIERFHCIEACRLPNVIFPLTPALSFGAPLGERESSCRALEHSSGLRFFVRLATVLPLPQGPMGEGSRGEGDDVKTTLNLKQLNCQTPKMTYKELLAGLISYSLWP